MQEMNIIYVSPEKVLYTFLGDCYINKMNETHQLSFEEFIREIDIIPEKSPEWKRETILKVSKDLGMFAA